MSEKHTRVQPYRVEYLCDDCGEPMTVWKCFTPYPPQFDHRCPNGHTKRFRVVSYPRIEYKEVE